MLSTAVFHPPEPSDWVTALDLAEALVERGIPFREAHHLVGGIVADLVARGESLSDLTENQLVERFRKLEETKISSKLDYDEIPGLSSEVKEKLKQVRPISLGQASRISGVTPAAISILMIYLKKITKSVA